MDYLDEFLLAHDNPAPWQVAEARRISEREPPLEKARREVEHRKAALTVARKGSCAAPDLGAYLLDPSGFVAWCEARLADVESRLRLLEAAPGIGTIEILDALVNGERP